MAKRDSIRLALGDVESKLIVCETLVGVFLHEEYERVEGAAQDLAFVFHEQLIGLRRDLDRALAVLAKGATP